MAFCGKCGQKIEEGIKFCPACGAPVEVNATQSAQSQQPAGGHRAKQSDGGAGLFRYTGTDTDFCS